MAEKKSPGLSFETQPQLTRRQVLLAAFAGVVAAGIKVGYDSRERSKQDAIIVIYHVKEEDKELGFRGIVLKVFPELSPEEAEDYIESGTIKNNTAVANKRNPTNILPGDELELPVPDMLLP